jgi:hypothetical protein
MKVAIVFRGFSYKQSLKKPTDWRLSFENFRQNILQSLSSHHRPDAIHIYLATYDSACVADIVRTFSDIPEASLVKYTVYPLTSNCSYNQRDTAANALALVDNPSTYNLVILTRFDLTYKKMFSEYSIKWAKMNIAWREIQHAWYSHNRVSDLIFIFPGSYLDILRKAIESHVDRSNLHKIYNHLLLDLSPQDIHFLSHDNEYFDSNTDKQENPYFHITRASS